MESKSSYIEEKCGSQNGDIRLSSSLLRPANKIKEQENSPSEPIINHVNQNETQSDDNKIDSVDKDITMSDDIVKTVGKLEANYEHMQKQQTELKASIEAMPDKIANSIKIELSGQIKDLRHEVSKEIKDSETKILQSENKIILWIAGLFITLAMITVIAPTLKEIFSNEKLSNYEHMQKQQPNIIMMPYPTIGQQQNPIIDAPVTPTITPTKENNTP